jgi:hypothetical protein
MPVDPHRRPIMAVVFTLLRRLIVEAAGRLTQAAVKPTQAVALSRMAAGKLTQAVANPMVVAVANPMVVVVAKRTVAAGITTKHPAADQIPGSGAHQLRCLLLLNRGQLL